MKRFVNLTLATGIITLCLLASVTSSYAQSNKEQIEESEKPKEKKKGGFFGWLFGGSSSKAEDPVKRQKSSYQTYTLEQLDHEFIEMSKTGNYDTMVQLLRLGANINAKNMQGRTALIEVARKGDVNTAKWLIQRGASVNQKDMYDGTALIYATQEGNRDVVNLLLQNGARKDIL